MKKIFFLPVLAFAWGACLAPHISVAQETPAAESGFAIPNDIPSLGAIEQPKPALTSPLTVALTYYKLTARAPDFESWIKKQDAYKNANSFDKPAVMKNMTKKLKDAYNLLLLSEPLIVEMQVQLSAYDAKNQGYVVTNFKPSTFFPASHAGENFAIVPQNIVDKQWLKVDDPAVADTIEKAAAANSRQLTMVLFLLPQYADKSSPTTIDGEDYWPLAASVKNMMLYQPGSNTLLWQSSSPSVSDKTREKLLKLYQ